jgi:hypothetical protein
MCCALGLIFGCNEGVSSRFHVLRARTRFRRYRRRRVMFSCFTLPDTFSAVRRASGLVFMFCCPKSFSAVPRASGPIFIFCAPGLISGVIEGVRSHFHVLRPDLFSAVPRAPSPVFMFWASGLVFDGTEVVGSRFHVLRVRTPFRRYRGRRLPILCFARLNPFSTLSTTSGPIFMFCSPRLGFRGTEGVRCPLHVLRSWTIFRRYRGRRLPL